MTFAWILLGCLIGFVGASLFFRSAILEADAKFKKAASLNEETQALAQQLRREREVSLVEREEANKRIAGILTPIINVLQEVAPESNDIPELIVLRNRLMSGKC